MGGGELPSMKWEDHYQYLCCDMGWDRRAKTKNAKNKYQKLLDSGELIDRLAETGRDEQITETRVHPEDDVAQPQLGEGT